MLTGGPARAAATSAARSAQALAASSHFVPSSTSALGLAGHGCCTPSGAAPPATAAGAGIPALAGSVACIGSRARPGAAPIAAHWPEAVLVASSACPSVGRGGGKFAGDCAGQLAPAARCWRGAAAAARTDDARDSTSVTSSVWTVDTASQAFCTPTRFHARAGAWPAWGCLEAPACWPPLILSAMCQAPAGGPSPSPPPRAELPWHAWAARLRCLLPIDQLYATKSALVALGGGATSAASD